MYVGFRGERRVKLHKDNGGVGFQNSITTKISNTGRTGTMRPANQHESTTRCNNNLRGNSNWTNPELGGELEQMQLLVINLLK